MANFNRRSLFKAVLFIERHSGLHHAMRSFRVDKPALVFTNRMVPCSWKIMDGSPGEQGYNCTFTEAFMLSAMRGPSLKDSILYKVGGNPVYFLNKEQMGVGQAQHSFFKGS